MKGVPSIVVVLVLIAATIFIFVARAVELLGARLRYWKTTAAPRPPEAALTSSAREGRLSTHTQ
jgi:hypothetical protein